MPLKDAIAFAYSHSLSVAPKADAELGGEDIAVVIERNLTNVRGKNDRHMQAGVTPDNYFKRATYLCYSVCIHLHI